MIGKNSTLVGIGLLTCIPFAAPAQEPQPTPDPLCQLLFDRYVVGMNKVDSDTMNAAQHLIASNGRRNGFWRVVLERIRLGDEDSEPNCVEILGKMLAWDAIARDSIQEVASGGPVPQLVQSIYLGPEVVNELLERAQITDRRRLRWYAVALVRARTPTTAEFFKKILRDDHQDLSSGTLQFHAAVGLAQIGDASGYEWLIAQSENPRGFISGGLPSGAQSGNLDACCLRALQQMVNDDTKKTKQDWVIWWASLDKKAIPKGVVELVDN